MTNLSKANCSKIIYISLYIWYRNLSISVGVMDALLLNTRTNLSMDNIFSFLNDRSLQT